MKRRDEELDEMLDDEFLDDEDEVLDDEDIDDLDDEFDDEDFGDEEFEDEAPKKKGKKAAKKAKTGKKGKKKKLSKGAVIGISISSSVVGVVAIALIVIFLILPLFTKKPRVASDFQELLAVNGYQNTAAADAAASDPSRIRSGATYDHIISVEDMLSGSGLKLNRKSDAAKLAAALYSLAITNYENINGKGWYCYTNSNVYASGVTAKLGPIPVSFDEFDVEVRAAYGLGVVEAKHPNAAQGTKENMFSQTISGVTELNVGNVPDNITNALKTNFGYNCQEFLYDGVYAYKRGGNGGAEFFGKEDEEGYLYLMGAYNEDLYSHGKEYKVKDKDPDSGYPEHTYIIDSYQAKYSEAKSLNETTKPNNIIQRDSAWGKLDTIYETAYTLKPYDLEETYYIGTYGTGWATYNFCEEYIDGDETTIEYDSDEDVYTINLVVKEEYADRACMFAKGSLTKDTKDYIQMQNSKYELKKNMIQIYGNGLIKYWEREETVSSDQKAKLTVLPGECAGGGGTTNYTYMAFSYSEIDYNPLALAARYLPAIADSSYGISFGDWPTLDEYDPKNVDYTK